jgi:murein DD-endopeptidase MepM/ murein hydrolase activator NlpD
VLRGELDGIDAELFGLTAAVDALASSIRMADPAVRRGKHELARAAGEAEVASLPSALGGAASSRTASALIQPLQTVNGAMRSRDAYVAALFQALASAHRRQVLLGALADSARLLHAELEVAMNELERLLSDATRTTTGAHGASSLLASVRTEIGRRQELLGRAERAEVDLRMSLVELAGRKASLLQRLKRADATGKALQRAMTSAEAFVGAAFASPALSATTPVIAGVLEVCPVDQPHSYTDDFGAPRWAGGYHPHEGNDIFAPQGTPIRAPFDGLAVAAPNALGGRAVIVYGDAGYVYNAHLSEYGALGRVSTGTIIGYVGNSGDAINGAPHDHFEWHPDDGEAVDPFPYLNAVCLLPSATSDPASA